MNFKFRNNSSTVKDAAYTDMRMYFEFLLNFAEYLPQAWIQEISAFQF